MPEIDVTTLDTDELLNLQTDIAAALKDRRETELARLRADIKQKMAVFGFTRDEILPPSEEPVARRTRRPRNGNGSGSIIRNPNGTETWSGQGRPPGWVHELAKERGQTIEQVKETLAEQQREAA